MTQELRLHLRFTRWTVPREDQRERPVRRRSEAAAGEQATDATEAEAERNSWCREIRGLPNVEPIALQKNDRA